jgi:hypothetical protein
MQIVIWVICGAGIALAAGVVHWKTARMRVELTPPQTVDGLEIRLPHGWMTTVGSHANIRSIRCAEQLPGGGFGRALVVVRQSETSESDPLSFLMTRVIGEDDAEDVDADAVERITVDGHKGVMLEFPHRALVGRTLREEQRTAACVIFEGGDAVVIQYIGQGDPNGKNLVRKITQSLRVVDDAGESAPPHSPFPVDGAV